MEVEIIDAGKGTLDAFAAEPSVRAHTPPDPPVRFEFIPVEAMRFERARVEQPERFTLTERLVGALLFASGAVIAAASLNWAVDSVAPPDTPAPTYLARQELPSSSAGVRQERAASTVVATSNAGVAPTREASVR